MKGSEAMDMGAAVYTEDARPSIQVLLDRPVGDFLSGGSGLVELEKSLDESRSLLARAVKANLFAAGYQLKDQRRVTLREVLLGVKNSSTTYRYMANIGKVTQPAAKKLHELAAQI